MAQKRSTGNMPRLEMLKLPPSNSSGFSRPLLAFSASSFISAEMAVSDFLSAFFTMGVMRPRSEATATETSTEGQGTTSPLPSSK